MYFTIIFTESFPLGLAGTNRIISISKGLIEMGDKVSVFCITPTEDKNNIKNNKVTGIYEKINFRYTSKTVIWPKSIHKKLYVYLKGILLCCWELRKLKKENKLDCILSSQPSLLITFLLFVFSKFYKVPLYSFIDEFPWILLKPEKYNYFYKKIYNAFYYKMFDGMFVMTQALINYYKIKIRKGAKLLLVPMTVELERFNILEGKNKEPFEYIAYCGNLGHNNKDGIPILIQAFKHVKKNYPNIKLYIIGKVGRKDGIELKNIFALVKELKLENDVIFTGYIPRDKIPEYLINSKVLVLARPNNLQAKGGFPTKLGEYLATGKPVVVTKVGDIPYYLTDGVNAFLAEPDNYLNFANKLLEVLDNYNEALVIGKNGKELALNEFNYKIQGKKIHNFIMAELSGDFKY